MIYKKQVKEKRAFKDAYRIMKKIGAFLLSLVMLLSVIVLPTNTTQAAEAMPTVSYSVHAQSYGWMNPAQNGKTAGTTGQGKRLEAIAISLKQNGTSYAGGLRYQAHVQTYGWMNWVDADTNGASPRSLADKGQYAGTVGKSKRMEAIRMELTGELANRYEVLYRVHMQTYGWSSWTKGGDTAGTVGQGKRLEAIEIKLIQKPSVTPAATVNYQVHAQSYGWMNTVPGGTIAGTTGKGKRLEAIKIDLKTQGVTGGIVYNTHVQSLGWTKDVSNNGVSGTTGRSKRIEAICMHLTGDITAYYDIYYRVHCQSLGWLDWAKNGQMAGTTNGGKRMEAIQIQLVKKGGKAPGATAKPYVYIEPPAITKDTYEIRVNKQESCITIYKDGVPIKAMTCSPGDATPVGTFYLAGKWRWNALMGAVQGQYCSQIQGDFLFHSVLYNKTNPRTLIPSSYNNLGKRVSHGCVRLQVIDAKWIFDNCPRGTKITIYNSSDPGPLGKPALQKIPGSQTWDPTDPAI